MHQSNLSNAHIGGAKLDGANIKSAIFTGVDKSDLQDLGIDFSSSITDYNVGRSVSDLPEPLPKMLEYHRDWLKTRGERGKQLDLTTIDLRILGSLKMEQLTAIKAYNAMFFGMNLYKVQMQSAVLNGSDFRDCDLEEADLRGSSFKDANLSNSNLRNADCGALVLGAGGTSRFNPCNFEGAKLRYADFSGAVLKNANFKNADLSFANLSSCDLRGADFSGAKIGETNLDNTKTEGAIFDHSKDRPVFRIPK